MVRTFVEIVNIVIVFCVTKTFYPKKRNDVDGDDHLKGQKVGKLEGWIHPFPYRARGAMSHTHMWVWLSL